MIPKAYQRLRGKVAFTDFAIEKCKKQKTN